MATDRRKDAIVNDGDGDDEDDDVNGDDDDEDWCIAGAFRDQNVLEHASHPPSLQSVWSSGTLSLLENPYLEMESL